MPASSPSPSAVELLVVMPIYNEQASVRKVIKEWFEEIQNWTEKFVLLAIDDGSTDDTHVVLNRLQSQLGERLEIVSRPNKGHGQSCLEGYREAEQRKVPWVLQLDSDGQCDPQYFFKFWRLRDNNDVIYGFRVTRDDGWRRVVASWILRFTLLATCRVWCVDANVPYRLMRTCVIRDYLDKIPPSFFLANVGLAVLLRKDPVIRHGRVSIRFRERYGGEPSVKLSKFGGKASQLISQISNLP